MNIPRCTLYINAFHSGEDCNTLNKVNGTYSSTFFVVKVIKIIKRRPCSLAPYPHRCGRVFALGNSFFVYGMIFKNLFTLFHQLKNSLIRGEVVFNFLVGNIVGRSQVEFLWCIGPHEKMTVAYAAVKMDVSAAKLLLNIRHKGAAFLRGDFACGIVKHCLFAVILLI